MHFIKVMAESFHSMVFLNFEKFVLCISVPASRALDVILLYQRLVSIFFVCNIPKKFNFYYKVTNPFMEFHTLLRILNLSCEFSIHYLSFTGTASLFRNLAKLFQYFLSMVGIKNIHIIQQHFNRTSVTKFPIDDTQ